MTDRLLLDTNVALWLLLGQRESVSDTARESLENERTPVSLSAVSVWEIAIKRSLGKLDIAPGWFANLMRLDFDPMPVSALHAKHVEELPWHHRDPFDRLLVAQATTEKHALVSSDARLSQYGIQVVW